MKKTNNFRLRHFVAHITFTHANISILVIYLRNVYICSLFRNIFGWIGKKEIHQKRKIKAQKNHIPLICLPFLCVTILHCHLVLLGWINTITACGRWNKAIVARKIFRLLSAICFSIFLKFSNIYLLEIETRILALMLRTILQFPLHEEEKYFRKDINYSKQE